MTSEDTGNGGGGRKTLKKALVVKRPPNRKYDWEVAEELYVNGEVLQDGSIRLYSVREVAERLNIPQQSAANRATTHRWSDKRRSAQYELAKARQHERNKKLANESIEFDARALDAAKIGVAMVTMRLGEIAREAAAGTERVNDAKERLKAGMPVDKRELYSAIYHRELVDLGSALATFQQVGMRALGTDAQKLEISGPEGGPIEQAVSVATELGRDDPERLAMLLKAMGDTGLFKDLQEEIIEAEVIDDVEGEVS